MNEKMTMTDIIKYCLATEDYGFAQATALGKWPVSKIKGQATWMIRNGKLDVEEGVYELITNSKVHIGNNVQVNIQAPVVSNKPYFDINKRFDFMEKLVGMIANGSQKSLFIAGPGGLGKTKTVIDSLNAVGCEYVMVKGFTTAKGLFNKLSENRDSVIVFDDCDTAFNSEVPSNIIKAATDSYDERIVSWSKHSSDDKETEFVFNGRIIFISNLSVDRFPQALQSRSTVVDLDMTTNEKIERMETVLDKLDGGEAEKHAALDFIKHNSDRIKDINFRTLIKITSIFTEEGITEDAKDLALFISC